MYIDSGHKYFVENLCVEMIQHIQQQLNCKDRLIMSPHCYVKHMPSEKWEH